MAILAKNDKSQNMSASMPIRVAFFLVHLFPLYVVMLAADVLRLANKHLGARKFDWFMVSEDGSTVQASNGMWLECDLDIASAQDLDYVFVIAGDDQPRSCRKLVKDWLIAMQRNGITRLGAIDSGAFLLASARLLGDRRVTVHPDSLLAFQEQFPKIRTDPAEIVESSGLITCAGGLTTATLMLLLTERHIGAVIASSVARDLVASESAATAGRNLPTMQRDQIIDLVVQRMKSAIEEPRTLDDLAVEMRLPVRSLSRLFQDHFGCGPMTYYRRLRLDAAKQLILQTDMAVSNIAIAVGFHSVSAFSRAFTDHFGQSPRSVLDRVRREGNAANVPERNHKKSLRTSQKLDPEI